MTMEIKPPTDNGKRINDYVRFSVPYLLYVILALMFLMWNDLSGKQATMKMEVQEVKTAIAVHQAGSTWMTKMADQVLRLTERTTAMEAKMESHREKSTYDRKRKD